MIKFFLDKALEDGRQSNRLNFIRTLKEHISQTWKYGNWKTLSTMVIVM